MSMQVVQSIVDARSACRSQKRRGNNVGLVPTMGFLHEGHISLVRQARSDNDFLVVSIFVNPTQFSPSEDFGTYPRNFEQDRRLLVDEGVDLIFCPSTEEMYRSESSTFIEVTGQLTTNLCAVSRPHFFRGVASVVAKLFNIINPHRAYFGQKDAQQLAVIKRMVQDLNFDIEIVPVPIVRDFDGLAKSSRNAYLNPDQRKSSTVLFRALQHAEMLISDGERNSSRILDEMERMIQAAEYTRIDYTNIVCASSFEPQEYINSEVLIAVAVWVASTRLIDNIQIDPDNLTP